VDLLNFYIFFFKGETNYKQLRKELTCKSQYYLSLLGLSRKILITALLQCYLFCIIVILD